MGLHAIRTLQFVHGKTKRNGAGVTNFFFGLLKQLSNKAGTVFQTATVFITAIIHLW